MEILAALKQEEARLQKQLAGIRGAIAALNGGPANTPVARKNHGQGKRTLSAAARAKISRAAKQRWAKFRAQKGNKG
jgi:hypothetical protein